MALVVIQGANGQEAKISCLLSTGFREAHAADFLAGGHEPRLGLALFQDCRLSIAFIEGSAIEIQRS